MLLHHSGGGKVIKSLKSFPRAFFALDCTRSCCSYFSTVAGLTCTCVLEVCEVESLGGAEEGGGGAKKNILFSREPMRCR